jgi:threonine dehydrogenase-like Zn-dependent dehydrogenase
MPRSPQQSSRHAAESFVEACVLAFVVRNHALAAVRKPLPTLRRGWALVRVRLAGICNTDVEILRGYHAFRGTPGHEFVGEVVDVHGVGSRVKNSWLERRVAGEINIACAALGFLRPCEFCRRGLKTHCARRRVLGIVGHDGAFAEFLALPIENLHAIPDTVTDEEAVFVEPLAAACEILTQLRVSAFRKAAVLGDGKLAQLIARVLTSVGVPVVMFGKHSEKLTLARRNGIKTVLVRDHATDLTSAALKGRFPLVVEATGSPTGLALGIALNEPRGTLVLKSTFYGAAPIESWPIVVNEIAILGSRCGPFPKPISLLRAKLVDPRPLITRTFPLDEASKAMKFAQHKGVLKVLLKP